MKKAFGFVAGGRSMLLAALLLPALLFTLFAAILIPQTAHAQTTAPTQQSQNFTEAQIKSATLRWLNTAKIEANIGGQKFIFFNNDIAKKAVADDNADPGAIADFIKYSIQGYTACGGSGSIKLLKLAGSTNTTGADGKIKDPALTNIQSNQLQLLNEGVLTMSYSPPGITGSVCADANATLAIADTGNGLTRYQLSEDGNTVGRVDLNNNGGEYVFTKDATDARLFIRNSDDDGCKDRLYVDETSTHFTMYDLEKGAANPPLPGYLQVNSATCEIKDGNEGGWILVPSNVPQPLGKGENATGAAEVGNAKTGGDGFELKCATWTLNPLTWVMCPLIQAAAAAVSALDDQINAKLTIKTGAGSSYDEKSAEGQPLYNVWSSMRTIALSLLVLISIIMVISQAVAIGPFDAYTVRKVLPRIIIAVIAISLSFQLCRLAITFSNDLGHGVGTLISAPFETGYKDPTINGGGLSLAAVGFAAAIIGGVDLLVILSLALTALGAVLIAFLMITFRSMLALLLVAFAPIAIVLWVLPNTQKGWKFWHGNMTAVLISYPIIIAFITIGRVFAAVASQQTDGSGDLVAQITVFIAYFGPYFAIPAAFRLAGGFIATIGGVANNTSKGFFDRNKKFRANQQAKTRQATKEGRRFTGKKWIPGSQRLARGYNMASVSAGTGLKGSFGIGRRGAQARAQASERAALESIMKDPQWNTVNQNDDALHAMTYNNASEATAALTKKWGDRERAQRATAAAQASMGFGRPQAIAAARQLVSTGTGYKDLQDMTQTLARASGGSRSAAASLSGFANSETKARGRFDLAPSFGELNKATQGEVSRQTGNDKGGQYKAYTQADYKDTFEKTWNSSSTQQLAQGKPVAMKQYAEHWTDRLQNGNQVQKRDAAVALMEMQNMLPGANAENQDIINKTLFKLQDNAAGYGINFNAGTSVEDQLAAIAGRNDPATGRGGAINFRGGAISGSDIRGMARVYDQSVPQGERGAPQE